VETKHWQQTLTYAIDRGGIQKCNAQRYDTADGKNIGPVHLYDLIDFLSVSAILLHDSSPHTNPVLHIGREIPALIIAHGIHRHHWASNTIEKANVSQSAS
jgi:hypothetical protein